MPPVFIHRRRLGEPQAGYVLLVLLLFLSLMVIAAAAVAPAIGVAIQRDREEELIHRGVQYTRAIRTFTRKFGHYPANLDELQSSNGQRFLRRKYKDPITGKDFKLLHFADVQLSNGPGVAAFSLASQPAGTQAPDPDVAGAPATPKPDPATVAQVVDGTADADAAAGAAHGQPGPQPGQSASPLQAGTAGSSGATRPGQPAQLGGGAILGVVSTSKTKGFHEFDHKSQYNDWKFYFDPGFDRGFPITGPTVRPVIASSGPVEPAGTPPDASQAPSQ